MFFRLAKELHWPSISEGLKTISSSEITEWFAYFHLEPSQEIKSDYRTASTNQLIYQMFKNKDMPDKPLEDFLLKYGEKQSKQETQEALITKFKYLKSVFGGSKQGKEAT